MSCTLIVRINGWHYRLADSIGENITSISPMLPAQVFCSVYAGKAALFKHYFNHHIAVNRAFTAIPQNPAISSRFNLQRLLSCSKLVQFITQFFCLLYAPFSIRRFIHPVLCSTGAGFLMAATANSIAVRSSTVISDTFLSAVFMIFPFSDIEQKIEQ